MVARRKPQADYAVGYGKPPADHRFRKGQSGNPRGRPRGSSNPLGKRELLDALTNAARLPVTVSRDGKAVRTTSLDAMLLRLHVQGMKGDTRAAKLILDTMRTLAPATDDNGMTHEEWLDFLGPPEPRGIQVTFVKPGDVTLDEGGGHQLRNSRRQGRPRADRESPCSGGPFPDRPTCVPCSCAQGNAS